MLGYGWDGKSLQKQILSSDNVFVKTKSLELCKIYRVRHPITVPPLLHNYVVETRESLHALRLA